MQMIFEIGLESKRVRGTLRKQKMRRWWKTSAHSNASNRVANHANQTMEPDVSIAQHDSYTNTCATIKHTCNYALFCTLHISFWFALRFVRSQKLIQSNSFTFGILPLKYSQKKNKACRYLHWTLWVESSSLSFRSYSRIFRSTIWNSLPKVFTTDWNKLNAKDFSMSSTFLSRISTKTRIFSSLDSPPKCSFARVSRALFCGISHFGAYHGKGKLYPISLTRYWREIWFKTWM